MKIGSVGEDVATMGMGDPEGEDGELIAGADEILAEELSQIVEGYRLANLPSGVWTLTQASACSVPAGQYPLHYDHLSFIRS